MATSKRSSVLNFATGIWNGILGLLSVGFVLLLIFGGLWLGGIVIGGIFGGSSSSSEYYSDYADNEENQK